MSLLVKGITKLSELEIDADKDWQVKGITNIKQVAASMVIGNLAQHNGTILQRIVNGGDGYVLTSQGLGKLLVWGPAGGALRYFFPVSIESGHAEAIVAMDRYHNEDIPLTSEYKMAYLDAPADMIKRLTPTLVSADAEDVLAGPDQTIAKTITPKSALTILCDGFVEEAAFDVGAHDAADSTTIMTDSGRAAWADDALIGKTIYNITDGSSGVITDNDAQTATVVALAGGADNKWQAGDTYIIRTDHTTEARDAAANDLNLNPMSDTVLDKVYIGSNYKFWQAQVLLGATGVGNWTNSWYYWNGAWVPVFDEHDGTNEWQFGTGLGMVSHTPQGDWVPSVIQGMNLYWLMVRTDNWVSRATKPLGSQIWVAIA